ncbi:MAG: hypothetical protein ACXWKP_08565 [Bradyrhizobium sp.]
MRRFSWQTMLIFVISLLLAVILLGLGTAYVSKLKQQRRQLSDSGVFACVNVRSRPQPTLARLTLPGLGTFLAGVG